MRNKLKRSGKCEVKAASCLSEEQQRNDQLITLVLSESSCSNDETSPETVSEKVKPQTFCVKDVKIAPIFFHAERHSKTKGSSDGQLGQEPVPPPPPPPQAEEHQQSLSSLPHLTERQRRKQLSTSALHSCLEEIQTSNPAFPVRTVFSTLQKRLQDFSSSENTSSLQNHLKDKRKRGNESAERVTKRLRSSLSAEGPFGLAHCQDDQGSTVLTVRKQRRSSKLSRTHRLRQQSGSPAGLVLNHQDPGLTNPTVSHSQSLNTSEVLQTDSSPEDVLWTDKYSPQHSSEVIGNSASVNKLQSWLKKWKQRADSDERRRMEERKREENNSDLWDCGDFQGEAGPEEPLSNTMLITGPPGVGKTASVYACALELGFKVFEVNCSSQRSGRHVLSQLKEATQSHLVETSGKDSLKPTYFNNYSITPKPSETSSGINMCPKKGASALKKRAAQKSALSSHKRKANPAAVTLANFFQMKAKADRLHFGGLSTSEKPDKDKSGNQSPGSDQTVPQNKKTATSLILFEEVDVIFDDDVGFLAAIKTFMTAAKRPVILTTNDPSFKEKFNCSLEEILFKTPSAVNVCSYLQLLGLAEGERLELDDVRSLLSRSRGDVRRCLLQLQLWVQSGGGSPQEQHECALNKMLSNPLLEQTCRKCPKCSYLVLSVPERDDVDPHLPPCGPGCTASMLGLHPVTQQQLLNLLKCQFWSETDMSTVLRLLAESWRGGVPLLYTNLELLLPVGAEAFCPGLQSELVPSDGKPPATNNKSFVKISRLSRRKYITSVSDVTSSSSPQQTEISSTKTRSGVRTEESKAKVNTGCLEALADFLDLMSYLDSTVPLVSGSCRPEAFVWTGAELKDGLSGETSEDEEAGRLWSQGKLLDLQAAVEGLGAHRCFWRVSEVWTEALQCRQELGDAGWGTLTLPSSSKRRTLSFSFQPLCAPSVTRRRYELSRMVLSSKSFSLLGNRRAISVDYMPVLRYICRFQREQQQKEAARSGNYLSRKHLGLSESTVQLLAEDFS